MKKLFFTLYVVILMLLLPGFSGNSTGKKEFLPGDSSYVNIFDKNNDEWVENTLKAMTLEEKAAQMVFAHATGSYMSFDSPQYERLVHLVKDVKVGGIIFFLSNIYDQAIITNMMQQMSEVPLLITADFERGVAQRTANATLFPYNMGIGAADDTALTYKMGEIIAREGLALGVHQNYAPVSDVNNNPYNPIINVRAFGEDVELVTRLSNAFLRGVQNGGMIATAKHFPGHGNTNVDSHRGLPLIDGSKDALFNTELYPFVSNIKNNVMSFMIGHLEVPSLEPKEKLPSTLSEAIVTGLLRNEMGFKGLIVTDAMNMRAITNSYTTGEATVEAVKAGNDAILYPDDAEVSVNAIIAAVKKGELTEERLDKSVRKILAAKKWAGLDKNKLVDISNIPNVVGTASHWNVAKELARKSITLVKDDNNIIPLSAASDIKYASINIIDSRDPSTGILFNRELAKRVKNLSTKNILVSSTEDDYDDALKLAGEADAVIINAYLKVRAYEGDLNLTAENRELVNEILDMDKPVVINSHGNPYILGSLSSARVYLCNYGDTEVSEEALAEALFGEIEITGKLPVSIPETDYKSGYGLQRPKTALLNKAGDYPVREDAFTAVDELIAKGIEDTAYPGAVLLIAKDGNIIHHKAFGSHTYNYDARPVDLNTMFDMASVTKVTATTTAAMICVDRGLFSLDDKVTKYIPEFGANGKENITIKNLMLHNAGLVAWKPFYKTEVKTADELLSYIYNSELQYQPGTKTVYSDWGLITVGKIIEKVTGKTLDRFCAEEIFEPLGMNRTMFNPPAALYNNIMPTEADNYWRNRLVLGTVHDETSDMLNGVAGHAGLFSTTGDMAKFLQMLLQKGTYQGRRLIKEETVELFTKKDSDLSSRAIGWDTKSPKGSSAGELFDITSYGHTGFTGTSVWTDPTRKLFVVLLTNRVYPTRENHKLYKFRDKIHDEIIKAIEPR